VHEKEQHLGPPMEMPLDQRLEPLMVLSKVMRLA
jgi:hypothetical protein